MRQRLVIALAVEKCCDLLHVPGIGNALYPGDVKRFTDRANWTPQNIKIQMNLTSIAKSLNMFNMFSNTLRHFHNINFL